MCPSCTFDMMFVKLYMTSASPVKGNIFAHAGKSDCLRNFEIGQPFIYRDTKIVLKLKIRSNSNAISDNSN